jgi:hypothetical protein
VSTDGAVSIGGLLLSRLYRKAEAVEQACLRAQGHPHDNAIRQELLSALEWEDSIHPKHARPLIRALFREVHDHSTELASRLTQNNSQVAPVRMTEVQTFRQGLSRLLHALATRHAT